MWFASGGGFVVYTSGMSHEKKPWYRTRNVVLATIALGVVVVGVAVFRSVNATPTQAVNYLEVYRDRIESGLPPGEDGWVHLAAATDAYQRVSEAARAEAEPLDWPADADWPAPFELVRDGIAVPVVRERTLEVADRLEAAGVLDALDRLAACPRAMRPIATDGRMVDVLLPELGLMRGIARYESMRLSLASSSGDWEAVARSLEHSLAMARVCTRQGTLIEHLVGHAIMSLALTELRTAVATHEPDQAAIERLLAVIERQQPMAEIAIALDSERLMVMDMIQATHTDDGDGSGRLMLSEFGAYQASLGMGTFKIPLMGSKVSNVAGMVFPSRKETTDKANSYYDACIAWSRQTRVERAGGSFDPDRWVIENIGWGDLVLRHMLPAIGRASVAADSANSELHGTRLMLLIERHRLRHGAYPESLDGLGVDPEALHDPRAGGPFGYRVDAPAVPNGYVLVAHAEDTYVPTPGGLAVIELDETTEDFGTRLNLPRQPD